VSERFAPAKINLALHVTGRRADGYHEIDTLVAFCGVGDAVAAAPSPRLELICDGPFAVNLPPEGGDNLVLRAAKLLGETAVAASKAVGGAKLTLTKRLPVASGIGGGSADAAATLLALAELWALPNNFDLAPVARRLGADVPMCLARRPLRARGAGERIEIIAGARPLQGLLINPGTPVATADVFAALAARDNSVIRTPIATLPDNPFDIAFLATLRNDLDAPAMRLQPAIAGVLSFLRACEGCMLARMSGSGATCFGLFATAAEAEAARRLAIGAHPHWWSVATTLGAGDEGGTNS
jgi:4-diphosphocytidyl-2-C-methyl-D-erythritol kinase